MRCTIRLPTDRLILRDFEEQDWRAVHEWNSDPETVRYLTWDEERTEAAARDAVREKRADALQAPRLEYSFIIVRRDSNQPIGEIGLHVRDDRMGAWVGYRIHPGHRGRGYATEALRRAVEFGFEQLNLHRIKLTVDPPNRASVRVITKLGFRFEGLVRDEYYHHGRWKTELHFAMLAHEWQARRGCSSPDAGSRALWDQIAKEDAREKPQGPPQAPPDSSDPVLSRSSNLVLREFREEDWQPLLAIASTPATRKLGSRLLSEGSEEAAREYVGQRIAAASERPRSRYGLVITSTEPDRVIGEIHLNNGWLAFQMCLDNWRDGCMTDVVRMALRFGFETLRLHRIAADCPAQNVAAARVLEEAGIPREAYFQEVSLEDGEWRSLYSYALLDNEWRASQSPA